MWHLSAFCCVSFTHFVIHWCKTPISSCLLWLEAQKYVANHKIGHFSTKVTWSCLLFIFGIRKDEYHPWSSERTTYLTNNAEILRCMGMSCNIQAHSRSGILWIPECHFQGGPEEIVDRKITASWQPGGGKSSCCRHQKYRRWVSIHIKLCSYMAAIQVG